MSTPRGSQDDRRLKNLLIEPTKQFRIALFTLFIGLAGILGFCGFEIWVFSRLVHVLIQSMSEPNEELNRLVTSSLTWSWVGLAFGAILFTAIVGSLTLMVTHRIYGPMVAIRRHLKCLLAGDYDQRTNLRKNDEFKDIAADLNALSDKLKGPSAG